MNLDKAKQITTLMKKRELLESKRDYFFSKDYTPVIGAIYSGPSTSAAGRYPFWLDAKEFGISEQMITTLIQGLYTKAMENIDLELNKL